MQVLFDTSVLVAALVEVHPMHHRALPWLKRAKQKKLDFFIASHSLAELYAVLTALPLGPRISPGTAWRLIHEDVETVAEIVPLSSSDYSVVVKRMSELGLISGHIYDALIAKAAEKTKVQRLLTLNPDDFKQVWPEGEAVIVMP
jgi:predicted nucleic acid-binding protein